MALRSLAALADRAPSQARRVVDTMTWLAASGFPHQGVPIPGTRDQRYYPVPPHGVRYLVDGDELIVLRITDVRRRRKPLR